MQNDLLAHFSVASDSQQFLELLPSSLGVVEGYVDSLRSGTVPLSKLLLTRNVTQKLEDYRQFNDGVAALMQLDAEGFDVEPGQAVRYIICDCRSRDPKQRVKIDSFITGHEEYDSDAYIDLLLRGAEGMLLPFGYDKARLAEIFGARNPRGR